MPLPIIPPITKNIGDIGFPTELVATLAQLSLYSQQNVALVPFDEAGTAYSEFLTHVSNFTTHLSEYAAHVLNNQTHLNIDGNKLLAGNLSIDNTTTLKGVETVMGTTAKTIDISTQWGGDTSKTYGGLTLTKDKNNVESWYLSDTVNGDNYLKPDTTAALTATVPAITADDMTLYLQTTHKITKTSNQGSSYTVHYNPFTGLSIIKITGSIGAGEELDSMLNGEVDMFFLKDLSATTEGKVFYGDANNYLKMFSATGESAKIAGTGWASSNAAGVLSFGTAYGVGDCVIYCFRKSFMDAQGDINGLFEIGQYIGTAGTVTVEGQNGTIFTVKNTASLSVASGIYQYLAIRGADGRTALTIIKRVDATGEWFFVSSDTLLQDKPLLLNRNYKANDINGDTIDDGAVDYLDSYSSFDYVEYSQVVDTSTLQLTNGVIGHTAGYDDGGAKQTITLKNGVVTLTTPLQQGTNYIYHDKTLDQYHATKYEPQYNRDYGFGDFYVTEDGKMYKTNAVFADNFDDGDTVGWTPIDGATLSVENGKLKVTAGGAGAWSKAQVSFSAIIGRKYKYIVSYTKGTDNANIRLGTTSGGADIVYEDSSTLTKNSDRKEYIFTATATTLYANLAVEDATSNYCYFDEIVIVPLNSDGSVYTTGATSVEHSYIAVVEGDANGNVVQIIKDTKGENFFDEVVCETFECRGDMKFTMPIFSGYLAANVTSPSTVINYTKEKDTHNAYKSGIFIVPIAGVYDINVFSYNQHGDTTLTFVAWEIRVNGTVIRTGTSQGTSDKAARLNVARSISIDLKEGDTVFVVATGVSATHFIVGSGAKTTGITIKWIGAQS